MQEICCDGDGLDTKSDISDLDSDEYIAVVQVLSFIVGSYNINVQACSLVLDLQDIEDDKLPDHLDGDSSVDYDRPINEFLERIASGPSSNFYI